MSLLGPGAFKIKAAWLSTLTVALLATDAATGEPQAGKPTSQLSFAAILEQARGAGLKADLDAHGRSLADAALRVESAETGAWRTEIETEVNPENTRERVGSFLIEKSLRFGIDETAQRKRFAAEAKAEVLSVYASQREVEMQLGEAYVEALHAQRTFAAASRTLDLLGPYLRGAEQAVQRGNASGTSVVGWQVFRSKLERTRKTAVARFEASLAEIGSLVGAKLGRDVATLALAGFDDTLGTTLPPPEVDPGIKGLKEREEALAQKSLAYAHAFEVAAGFGMARSFSDGANAVIAKVSVPLGQGALNSARQSEAASARSLIAREAELKIKMARERLQRLAREIAFRKEELASLSAQRAELVEVQTRTIRGLQRGIASLDDLVGLSETLFDLDLEIAEAAKAKELGQRELMILTGDSL